MKTRRRPIRAHPRSIPGIKRKGTKTRVQRREDRRKIGESWRSLALRVLCSFASLRLMYWFSEGENESSQPGMSHYRERLEASGRLGAFEQARRAQDAAAMTRILEAAKFT